MKRSSTPFFAAQVCIVRPANSGPLSVRITWGRPRSALTWSSTRDVQRRDRRVERDLHNLFAAVIHDCQRLHASSVG
jgi:hypothetical protein